MTNIKYYSSKETCHRLGICRKTLQNWANDGKIDYIRTEGNWRKYNLDKYLNDNDLLPKLKVCYCRVSSYDQKEDLSRQIKFLKKKYQNIKLSQILVAYQLQKKRITKITKFSY
jgi:predicted site-specific integrase-resolvase